MTEEITASCAWDVSSHLPSYKWANWKQRWRLPFLILMAAGCLLYAFWLVAQARELIIQEFAPYVVASVAAGFGAYRIFSFKAEYIRQLKLTPGYGQKAIWMIKKEGYEESLDGNHFFTPWANVNESKETPEGVMVFLKEKGLFNWIPRGAFCDTDYHRFLELLKAKTKHSTVG